MQSYTVQASKLVGKSWLPVSDTDIVPESDQNKLMWWRDIFRAGEFDIGDIANRLCSQALERGFEVTQQRIFDAVGAFCGRSGRTVRYYAETARFYDDITRSEYNVLPFSHFVLARYTGERWKDVLDYAMLHPKISEENLRVAFTAFDLTDSTDRVSEDNFLTLTDSTERVSEDKRVSGDCSPQVGNAVSLLSSVLEQLETILNRSKLSEAIHSKIVQIMIEFRSLIPEIARELMGTSGEN